MADSISYPFLSLSSMATTIPDVVLTIVPLSWQHISIISLHQKVLVIFKFIKRKCQTIYKLL